MNGHRLIRYDAHITTAAGLSCTVYLREGKRLDRFMLVTLDREVARFSFEMSLKWALRGL